jgi:hypothetical protein
MIFCRHEISTSARLRFCFFRETWSVKSIVCTREFSKLRNLDYLLPFVKYSIWCMGFRSVNDDIDDTTVQLNENFKMQSTLASTKLLNCRIRQMLMSIKGSRLFLALDDHVSDTSYVWVVAAVFHLRIKNMQILYIDVILNGSLTNTCRVRWLNYKNRNVYIDYCCCRLSDGCRGLASYWWRLLVSGI